MKKIYKFSMIILLITIILIIIYTIINKGNNIKNQTGNKIAVAINVVKTYGTDYIYDESMPSTAEPVVIEEGINGLDFTYDGINYTHLSDVKNEVVKKGSGKQGEYTGRLTGYGPDCPGCSAVGNVACRTKNGKNHSLTYDGLYYEDELYGNVRILAADNGAFPCGTIVIVNNGILDEFYGIVLDSGSTMRNAWKNGTVWMDMAFDSQKIAKTAGATSSNTTFSVQRWGW